MEVVWYKIIPRCSRWNCAILLNQLSIKRHGILSPLGVFINIIGQSAPCCFNSVWTFFPFTQWSQWTYSQHTSAVLPRVSFTKVKHRPDLRFKVIQCFILLQFRSSYTDTISYYVKTNCASNLLFNFSFAILRFLVNCSGLAIETLCKPHGDLFGRNVSQLQTSFIPLCKISLFEALQTSSVYLDSFYTHCTHDSTVRKLASNKLEVLLSK